MNTFFFVILFLIYNSYCARHTKEEWRSRSIYQIVTDRFAKDETDTKSDCENLRDYCGGTFKGIQQQLDYISGMGFDAIWISPVLKNAKGAYHGYHIIDYYNVNEHFGSSDDLKELIQACHRKNIWVILDAVPNHMAPDINFSTMIPFNKDEYYHEKCDIIDEDNIEQRENCWLYGLPDLNQDNPFVRKTLLEWVKNMIIEYDFDGVRYADVPYISKSFWKEFTEYANTYAFGLVCGNDVNQVSHYQKYMDAVGNFPLFYIIRDCFSGSSLKKIDEYLQKNHSNFMNPSYDGIFLDNHDNPRFMNISKNKNGLKNAIVFTFFF
jgi:alpha-amylase